MWGSWHSPGPSSRIQRLAWDEAQLSRCTQLWVETSLIAHLCSFSRGRVSDRDSERGGGMRGSKSCWSYSVLGTSWGREGVTQFTRSHGTLGQTRRRQKAGFLSPLMDWVLIYKVIHKKRKKRREGNLKKEHSRKCKNSEQLSTKLSTKFQHV
jgi:hypothetical protein